MRFRNGFYLIVFLVVCSFAGAEMREFTNKDGKTIKAELVSVTADWSKVALRKDGQDYVLSTASLSLDDQQYIKAWLNENGVTSPDQTPGAAPIRSEVAFRKPPVDWDTVRLSIKSTKDHGGSDRIKDGYYRYDTKEYSYTIEVTNLSKVELDDLILEFVAVWDEETQLPNTKYISDGKKIVKGARRLKGMVYNQKQKIITPSLSLHSRSYDTYEYGEDKSLGLLVRIKNQAGRVIEAYRDGDAEREELTWDDTVSLPPGSVVAVPRTGPINLVLEQGDSVNSTIPVRNRDIEIEIKQIKPKTNAGGVIAEIGGGKAGISVYLKDRSVVLSARDKGKVHTVQTPIPLGEFNVIASLDKKGLSLITGSVRSEVDKSITGLSSNPTEGLTIGTPGAHHVDNYGSSGDFLGEIGKLMLRVNQSAGSSNQ